MIAPSCTVCPDLLGEKIKYLRVGIVIVVYPLTAV